MSQGSGLGHKVQDSGFGAGAWREPRPTKALSLTGPERGKRSALGRRFARAVARSGGGGAPRLPPEGETGKGANPVHCCRRLITTPLSRRGFRCCARIRTRPPPRSSALLLLIEPDKSTA